MTTNQKYLVLACDGGGIRGLITALLLEQLGPGLLGQVYLFAGTSTGGILSLGLACGVPVAELVSLYETDGEQIFTKSQCLGGPGAQAAAAAALAPAQGAPVGGIWTDILQYLAELICVKYDNAGLMGAVNSTLGGSAGATLSSLDRNVMVTTFQLYGNEPNGAWGPLELHNIPNITDNPSASTKVIDAAMSTSAAPTYFPPYNHPAFGYCADGGVFANNPALLAVSKLIESGIPLESIWVLSLSTGNTVNSYPPSLINSVYAPASAFGPFFWLFPEAQQSTQGTQQTYTPGMPLTSALFDGVSEVNDYQCSLVIPKGQYKRANVPLTAPVALDDYSPQAIQAMKDAVSSYTGESGGEWAGIVSWINDNFPGGS